MYVRRERERKIMKRVEGGKFKTCGEHGKWAERERGEKKAE